MTDTGDIPDYGTFKLKGYTYIYNSSQWAGVVYRKFSSHGIPNQSSAFSAPNYFTSLVHTE